MYVCVSSVCAVRMCVVCGVWYVLCMCVWFMCVVSIVCGVYVCVCVCRVGVVCLCDLYVGCVCLQYVCICKNTHVCRSNHLEASVVNTMVGHLDSFVWIKKDEMCDYKTLWLTFFHGPKLTLAGRCGLPSVAMSWG